MQLKIVMEMKKKTQGTQNGKKVKTVEWSHFTITNCLPVEQRHLEYYSPAATDDDDYDRAAKQEKKRKTSEKVYGCRAVKNTGMVGSTVGGASDGVEKCKNKE